MVKTDLHSRKKENNLQDLENKLKYKDKVKFNKISHSM